jgi:HAD superfamily hydrolase (TIGR01490 family)
LSHSGERMTVAIFDLDGTLSSGHIVHGVVRHHRLHRVKRLPVFTYMSTHVALWPLWKLGLISEARARELWIRDMGWTVRGWTPQEAAPAFAWIAQECVLPLARPDVVARLHDHQAAAHRVILVSGTMAPLLAEVGSQFGVEETVGTPLVLHAGRYTGASEPPPCHGPGKVSRLEAYLEDSGGSVWSQSYAYADSCTDLPLLECVDHPVAVYPDAELAAHARTRGWEIIGEGAAAS